MVLHRPVETARLYRRVRRIGQQKRVCKDLNVLRCAHSTTTAVNSIPLQHAVPGIVRGVNDGKAFSITYPGCVCLGAGTSPKNSAFDAAAVLPKTAVHWLGDEMEAGPCQRVVSASIPAIETAIRECQPMGAEKTPRPRVGARMEVDKQQNTPDNDETRVSDST